MLRLLVLAVALLGAVSTASAAAFTVNSTADAPDATPGDGVCAAPGGACTLRAAIHETNALAGPDQINVLGGTYTLTRANSPLTITDSVTLTGAGAASTIIDGAGITGVIRVSPRLDVAVTISDLTVQNGNGGGITTPILTSDFFIDLMVLRSVVRDSTRQELVLGACGGFSGVGRVTFRESTVSGEAVCYENQNDGRTESLRIENSTISSVRVDGSHTFHIVDSTIGGVLTAPVAAPPLYTISRSTLGTVSHAFGRLSITNSTVTEGIVFRPRFSGTNNPSLDLLNVTIVAASTSQHAINHVDDLAPDDPLYRRRLTIKNTLITGTPNQYVVWRSSARLGRRQPRQRRFLRTDRPRRLEFHQSDARSSGVERRSYTDARAPCRKPGHRRGDDGLPPARRRSA